MGEHIPNFWFGNTPAPLIYKIWRYFLPASQVPSMKYLNRFHTPRTHFTYHVDYDDDGWVRCHVSGDDKEKLIERSRKAWGFGELLHALSEVSSLQIASQLCFLQLALLTFNTVLCESRPCTWSGPLQRKSELGTLWAAIIMQSITGRKRRKSDKSALL